MKKAKAYMRMSTDRQEHSIKSQWRLIVDYAAKNGYALIGKYEDEGISGRDAEKRPAFMQMIEDSESGEFEAVIIYDSSRFARNLKDAIVYKSILKKNGVDLISITEPTLDDDTSLITDALMGAMNEMYSRKLSKNVKRGQEQKILRGETFSKPPFGYARPTDTGQYEIVESEAEIIRYIYDQYAAGRTSFSLAKELAATEIRTRQGNRFDSRQIDRILTSAIYKGWIDITTNGTRYFQKAQHPPIIPEEQFNQMQKIIEEQKLKHTPKQRSYESTKHWLSGKVRCSACGASYTRRMNQGGRSPSFICCNYSRGKCKNPPYITQPQLEATFIEAVKLFLAEGSTYNVTVEPRPRTATPDYATATAKLEQSLKRAKEAFLAGVDTIEEYKVTKKNLNREIAKIQEEQEKTESPDVDCTQLRKALPGLISLLENPAIPLIDKQKAVSLILKNIIINKDRSISVLFYSL